METVKTKTKRERVKNEFDEIWAEEKDRFYTELKLKRKQEIGWIKRKYYKKDDFPDIIEGVIVKDQKISEEFEMNTVTYGNAQLTSDVKSVMKLHPKYTVFD